MLPFHVMSAASIKMKLKSRSNSHLNKLKERDKERVTIKITSIRTLCAQVIITMEPSSTHKRTSSAAGNTTEAPETKRRTEVVSEPQVVYVVVVTSSFRGEGGTDIRGIYSTLEDANNRVRGIVSDDYEYAEDARRSSHPDGRVSWASDDVGEGDTAEIKIEIHEVRPAASEGAREWPSENGDGSGSEENAERDDTEDET